MKKQILDKTTWVSLRRGLNNNYSYNETWEKIISLFKQRIDNFYFEPIQLILKPNLKKGEGFAIVTLQCALIEMFAAFKYGKIHNRDKQEGGPSYKYKSSDQYFIKFLKSESIFENHFFSLDKRGNKQGNTPYNAKDFYGSVRCGLMHEARTKKDWRITAKAQKDVPSNIFITIDEEGVKQIHRTNLHDLLKDYFDNTYLTGLRQQNENGNQLRRFLARKLDHLHDVRKDFTYEWWKNN